MAPKTFSTRVSRTLALSDLLTFFQNNYSGGSLSNYISNIKYFEKLYQTIYPGQSIVDWFDVAFTTSASDPLIYVMNQLNSITVSSKLPAKTLASRISRFRKFAQFVIGFFDANIWLKSGNHDLMFCQLIASNALFADPLIYRGVRRGFRGTKFNINAKKSTPLYRNPYGSWDYMVHYRDTRVKKGTKTPNPTFPNGYPGTTPYKVADNNNMANSSIKEAVLESFERKYGKSSFNKRYFQNYEACHIWANPTEREYYCSIGNLVLIPRALAQLTDHNDAVKVLLRERAYELFGFHPNGTTVPESPYSTKVVWRQI